MKKMHSFIGMSFFVVALVFTSVTLTGCDLLNSLLSNMGLGGDDTPEEEPEVPEPTVEMATGGTTTFIKVDNVWYEVHTFSAAETTLSFSRKPATVEVLVVAGGGGGGKGGPTWHAGGGGAGGYIYAPSYPVGAGPITVQVGTGGSGVTGDSFGGSNKNAIIGGTGGNSVFGGITAIGGGGGASHTAYIYNDGQAGGSGGGGSASGLRGGASEGIVPDGVSAVKWGNDGGGPTTGGSGCGGGGAGSAGESPGTTVSAAEKGALGGYGVQSDISGEYQWYAGGGAGGMMVTVPEGSDPPPEAYGATGGHAGAAGTGDGGSGGGGSGATTNGGDGGSGIVIARWPYVASAP